MCLTEQESFRLENAEGFLQALLKLRQDHMRLSEKGGQDMGHMVSNHLSGFILIYIFSHLKFSL